MAVSIAAVRSPAQAGSYYGADNYYTSDENEAASQWFGEGAKELGLDGLVHEEAFEKVLSGELPDGTVIGEGSNKEHRAGIDITFSAPKSLSILGLVGGDDRLVREHMAAVKDTLTWAEKNLSEARIRAGDRVETVKTGNLTVALFAHDTSRDLDPQMHVHAVIANATQTADGKWRALHNDKLWSTNGLLRAVFHSYLRERVEHLGYETETTGKRGIFEIKGVSREQIEAFSSRRATIVEKSEELGITSPKGFDAIAVRTRDRKVHVNDRQTLYERWEQMAQDARIPVDALIRKADERSSSDNHGPFDRQALDARPGPIVSKLQAIGAHLRDLFTGRPDDPYYARPGMFPSPKQMDTAHAVAASIHHLSERETSFSKFDIAAASLHLGLPTNIDLIERQVERLVESDKLLRGEKDGQFTTLLTLRLEQNILDESRNGRDATTPIFADRDTAAAQVQLRASENGTTLNLGQDAAAQLILSSGDRFLNIQGDAGSGKTTMLRPVSQILTDHGKNVLMLGVQHTLVNQLGKETNMPAQTVAKFLATHRNLLRPNVPQSRIDEARDQFRGSVIFVDEASMLSNLQSSQLKRLGNLLEVDKMIDVGDWRQLGAVEAGKPFEVSQRMGDATAQMTENVRARNPALLSAAKLANSGEVRASFAALREHIIEMKNGVGEIAADRWLSLGPATRESTLVMTSGRELMKEVNERIQDGLRVEGVLKGEGHTITIYDKVHATRAELQSPATYERGMIIQIPQRLRSAKSVITARSEGVITNVDREKETVTFRDETGRNHSFSPRKLPRNKDQEPLRLLRPRDIKIHEGDRLRFTDTDKTLEIYNAEKTKILGIDQSGVRVTNGQGTEIVLPFDHPMLKRVDLAYTLNTHQLQGATADNVIAAARSTETNLATAKNFLVNITRARDNLVLIVDDAKQYGMRIDRNRGEKESALETLGRLLPWAAQPVSMPDTKPTQPQNKHVPQREPDLSISSGSARNRDFER